MTEIEGVSKEDILASLNSPMVKAFNDEGITPKYLASKHKRELNAKETKVFKGKVLKRDPATSEIIEVEEVIYSKPMTAWDIRQKARQDAHKLRGDYPPEKKEIGGFDGRPISLKVIYEDVKNGNGDSDSEAV